MGAAFQVGLVVACDHVVGDGLHSKGEAGERLHSVVGWVAQGGLVLVQCGKVHCHAHAQHARVAVGLAVGECALLAVGHAESPGVVAPVGHDGIIHLCSALIETVAVAHAAQVHEILEVGACRHGIHHFGVSNDDDVERPLSVVFNGCVVVGVVHAVVVAHELVHDDALALVVLEDACGQAVLLVENFVDAHIFGVGRRINQVGHQHAHVAWALRLEDGVEDALEVGVSGIARSRGGGINVSVLQERVDGALIRVDVVVHNADGHMAGVV